MMYVTEVECVLRDTDCYIAIVCYKCTLATRHGKTPLQWLNKLDAASDLQIRR